MQEAGATADIELAYTPADGLEYLRTGVNSGMNIDDFAPRLLLGQRHELLHGDSQDEGGKDALGEVSQPVQPEESEVTGAPDPYPDIGRSLTEQDPFNNVGRTCIEAMAAALGHTQSLHTNALDEAIALPTDFSARIARNTQIFIQEETSICKSVDPGPVHFMLRHSLTRSHIRHGS